MELYREGRLYEGNDRLPDTISDSIATVRLVQSLFGQCHYYSSKYVEIISAER